jgi:hypothetical protein
MVMAPVGDPSSGKQPEDLQNHSQEQLAAADETPAARRERLLTSPEFLGSMRKAVRSQDVPDDDVEDVVQEAVRQLLGGKLPEDDEEARTYANVVARNIARQRYTQLIEEATEPYREEPDEDGGLPTAVAAQPARFDDRDLARQIYAAGMARYPRTVRWFWRARVLGETAEAIASDYEVQPSHVRKEITVVHQFMHGVGVRLGAVVAVTIVVALGVFAWLRRPIEAIYVPQRVEPPAPDTRMLRERAERACRDGAWQACIDDIDAADALDPADHSQSLLRQGAAAKLHLRDGDMDPKGPTK